jgi:hypothetical protein
MFTKLQFYIILGCLIAAGAVLLVLEISQHHQSSQSIASSDSNPSNDATAQEHPTPTAPAKEIPKETATPKPATKPSPADTADDRIIDAAMEKLLNCFRTGDFSYDVDVMYAPFVEKGGGKKKVMELCEQLVQQMKEQQITIVSWETKKPYRYIEGTSNKYAIIPYESLMTVADRKMRQNSFQLAIKAPNANWQFITGDQLTPEIINAFFPDFPKNVEFPERKQSYED